MATHNQIQLVTEQDGQSPTPAVGHIYGDARHTTTSNGEITYNRAYEVVYADADRLLLSETGSPEYRYEKRTQFVTGIGQRWELLEVTDTDAPDDTGPSASQLLSLARHLRDAFDHENNPERVVALDQFLELADHQAGLTEIDWTRVDGVGKQTAANLREHGFHTDADLLVAPDDSIRAVDGVGKKTLENLYEYIKR